MVNQLWISGFNLLLCRRRSYIFELSYFNVLSISYGDIDYAKCVSLFDTSTEWNCHRQRLIKSKVCSPKKVTRHLRWGESDPERSRLWLAFLDLFVSVIHDIRLDVECLWYDTRSCLFHADHMWVNAQVNLEVIAKYV